MSSKAQGLTLGLILVLVGGVWLAGNLGWLDTLDTLRRWWPLSFLIWGVTEILASLLRRGAKAETNEAPRGELR